MNFGNNSGNDESGDPKQSFIIARERRMCFSDSIAHHVMLASEEVLQQSDANPAIERVADEVGARDGVPQQAALHVRDVQLAVATRARTVDGAVVLAVEKAGIPPVSADVVEEAVGAALGSLEAEGLQRALWGGAVEDDGVITVGMSEPVMRLVQTKAGTIYNKQALVCCCEWLEWTLFTMSCEQNVTMA